MKNNMSKNLWFMFSAAYFTFFIGMYCATPAFAYVDPATTAMITQIVAGIIISLGVALGIFRRKIILFFKNLSVNNLQRKIEKQNRKTDDNK